MPSLEFKGKQFVANHHYSVPFRELVIDKKKSHPANGKPPSLDDNLIIHGDNLEALKALLPAYAGKVKCIYIDPPYNTGNESWAYNDNVRAPFVKEWLGKAVGTDDLERHDKWLCMMMPRLILLRELLADDGFLFISIDSIELASLRLLVDEVFGPDRFLALISRLRKKESANDNGGFSLKNDYVLAYRKSESAEVLNLPLSDAYLENSYNEPTDRFPLARWRPVPITTSAGHQGGGYRYEITTPSGKTINRSWLCPHDTYLSLEEANRLYFGIDGSAIPQRVIYENESNGTPPSDAWYALATNKDGKKELAEIFSHTPFDTPKPTRLIAEILRITVANDKDAIILDSFAGSGTTAQAVLALNKEDVGNRKFILVEVEDYADKITAERVRRVIKGVPGAKDEDLKAGLGGSFTYCELGEPITIENLLTGNKLPSYDTLARYVFYTATGQTLDKAPTKPRRDHFIGETATHRVHLIYKPDNDFLRSNEAILTLAEAETIAATAKPGKQTLVFAAGKFMSQRELTANYHIEFCQLPYAIHRVFGN